MLTVGSPRVSWARVRLARFLSIGGLAAFSASALAPLLPYPGLPGLGASTLSLLSLAAFLASFVVWFARATVPGSIEIDELGVRIRRGGTREVSVRERIQSAYHVQRYVRGSGRIFAGGRRASTVEVLLEGGDVVAIEVASVDEAREVVRRLGFGPGQRRVTMALGAPVRRLYHLLAGVGAYYVGMIAAIPFHVMGGARNATIATIVMPVLTLAAYFALKALLREPVLVVGTDGLLVRAGRRRRFLGASTIRGVEQPSIAMPLLVRTGDRGLAEVIDGKALDLERRGAAATLLYERFVAPARSSSRDVTAETFARRDRSLADWRNDLAAHAQAGSYRRPAAHEDAPGAVLASVRASSDERAGAALALRIAGEPERIRVAATGVADEHLREALEAIAGEEDDEALDRALRRLDRPG